MAFTKSAQAMVWNIIVLILFSQKILCILWQARKCSVEMLTPTGRDLGLVPVCENLDSARSSDQNNQTDLVLHREFRVKIEGAFFECVEAASTA